MYISTSAVVYNIWLNIKVCVCCSLRDHRSLMAHQSPGWDATLSLTGFFLAFLPCDLQFADTHLQYTIHQKGTAQGKYFSHKCNKRNWSLNNNIIIIIYSCSYLKTSKVTWRLSFGSLSQISSLQIKTKMLSIKLVTVPNMTYQ